MAWETITDPGEKGSQEEGWESLLCRPGVGKKVWRPGVASWGKIKNGRCCLRAKEKHVYFQWPAIWNGAKGQSTMETWKLGDFDKNSVSSNLAVLDNGRA